MSNLVIPVILCGGAGTRLWPASNDAMPKPFLPLVDGRSTFQLTLERVADDSLFSPPVIVASRRHRYLVADACAGVPGATILLEPQARDTTTAIAAAASWASSQDPEAVVLILAADHLIRDVGAFADTIRTARPAVEAGYIVVFGIRPAMPATGYGYIRRGHPLEGIDGVDKVAAFVEKPDVATAERYIADGYLWNSGNFMMQAATALAEVEQSVPAVGEAAKAAVADAEIVGNVVELAAEPFARATKISFDHGVMEKTDRAAVVAAGYDWSDLGTWSSIWEAAAKDDAGNVATGDAVLVDATGNYVSTDRPLVGVIGLEDIVVVASDNAVLVAPRHRSDAVKTLVAEVNRAAASSAAGNNARRYRPWGYFQSLDAGATYQVKRIVVSPGGRLSLQRHERRSEHWTIVDGSAEVTIDADVRILSENQSVFIPEGSIHRLANPGKSPLIVIEVQVGTYFGEDDVVRFEDDYGRLPV